MKINTFQKAEFGKLTTITSKTGVVMFIGPEIGKMWGHTNLNQIIKRILNKDESKVVRKSDYPSLFDVLVSNKLLLTKTFRIQLLTESAVYKLALASNLDKAKPFRDWVASEVLPSIRKNGYYSIADQQNAIQIHTVVSIQKSNSKEINKKHYIEKGLDGVIEYNRDSCLLHTGKSPSQIRKMGKEMGLKSKACSSAKEVLRNTDPASACAMSFTDSLVKKGFNLKTVSELSMKCAYPLFQGMLELGITPSELGEK